MTSAVPEAPKRPPQLGRWQFGPGHILVATTGVAAILGLAVWGGWVYSDAVVCLSVAMLVAVFSSTARRAMLGSCIILGMFVLALILGDLLFGVQGRGGNPRSFWIFAGVLTISAMLLRLYSKAGAFSLAASLVFAEVFTAIVVLYTYGCPTLFEAFGNEHRRYVLQHLRQNFSNCRAMVDRCAVGDRNRRRRDLGASPEHWQNRIIGPTSPKPAKPLRGRRRV